MSIEEEVFDASGARGTQLANSRPLDVHTWSEHPEVNSFVDAIYVRLPEHRKIDIRKKHVKVVLLDLYLNWWDDPERYLSVPRSPNAYRANSRYNELHISRTTIQVVDDLLKLGLIDQVIGFRDERSGVGKLSRIRPTAALTQMFAAARFSPFDTSDPKSRVTVIVRDTDASTGKTVEVEYEPTVETERMSRILERYNALLRRTFIDIPDLGESGVLSEDDAHPIFVSHHDRFVRRVFNRGSLTAGGRFFGGWWQRCPSDARTRIFINDDPTTEVDYSGLHIVMLYAKEGIAYWDKVRRDPYGVPVPGFLPDPASARSVAKSLMLMSLNARTKKEAMSAFREKAKAGSREKHLTNKQLSLLLHVLERMHQPIAKHFYADAGATLMFHDSQISELIIDYFVGRKIPILAVHDSYIVPVGRESLLQKMMRAAFYEVMKVRLGHAPNSIKEKSDRVEDLEMAMHSWQPYGDASSLEADEAIVRRVFPTRSPRYERNLSEFRTWLAREKQKER